MSIFTTKDVSEHKKHGFTVVFLPSRRQFAPSDRTQTPFILHKEIGYFYPSYPKPFYSIVIISQFICLVNVYLAQFTILLWIFMGTARKKGGLLTEYARERAADGARKKRNVFGQNPP